LIGKISHYDTIVSGSISGSSQTIEIDTSGLSSVGIQITGSWVGGLEFNGTVDGTTWVQSRAVQYGGTLVGGTAANGVFFAQVGGLLKFNVSGSTWTSGTGSIYLEGTTASNAVTLANSLPVGSNVIGALSGGTIGLSGSSATLAVTGSQSISGGTIGISGSSATLAITGSLSTTSFGISGSSATLAVTGSVSSVDGGTIGISGSSVTLAVTGSLSNLAGGSIGITGSQITQGVSGSVSISAPVTYHHMPLDFSGSGYNLLTGSPGANLCIKVYSIVLVANNIVELQLQSSGSEASGVDFILSE